MAIQTYRHGTVKDAFGFIGWVIQEKRWWGWRTLVIYNKEQDKNDAVKELKKLPNVIVL
jgi:hypothetical protein